MKLPLVLTAMMAAVATGSAGCPDGCLCTSTEQVVCQNNEGLTEIPRNLPTTTLHLSIKKTGVRAIPSQVFRHLTHLKRLHLDNNRIVAIERDAFLGLGNMEELSLQNNPLSQLTPGAFSGLFNVRNVYLGYNQIREIQEKAFFGSENIKSLSLQGNPLKTIRSGAFWGLKNVDYIHLPYEIQLMQPRAFYGLSNVSTLQFEALRTDAIAPSTFEGLSGVAHLALQQSDMGAIQKGAFRGLKNVSSLTIEGSAIRTIEAAAFAYVHAIDRLTIADNRIANLHPGAFDGLLHSEANIKSIVVTGNLVPCDCRLHWFRDHALVVPSIMRDNNCSEPDHYQGWPLDSVPLDGLGSCSPSETSYLHAGDDDVKMAAATGDSAAGTLHATNSARVSLAVLLALAVARRWARESPC